jgi:hypothetical protein
MVHVIAISSKVWVLMPSRTPFRAKHSFPCQLQFSAFKMCRSRGAICVFYVSSGVT